MDARLLGAVVLAAVAAWPVSARTVRCRDGTRPATPASADVPACDVGAPCDGLCTFAVPTCPCRSCACPAVVCDPGRVAEVSLPARRRFVLEGCRARGTPTLVLRCSAKRCASTGVSR